MGLFALSLVFCCVACQQTNKSNKVADKHPYMLVQHKGNANVQSSLEDKTGNLWFATTDDGLYRFNGDSFVQYTKAHGLINDQVSALLEDREGRIWVGTKGGPCVFDGKRFIPFPIPLPKDLAPNQNAYFQNHWVYCMVQDNQGKIWFATIDGVYVYDSKSISHFPLPEAQNGFLTRNDKVEKLLVDKAGNIWMGGRTNPGIFRFDGKNTRHFELEVLYQQGPQPKPHAWGWPQWQDKDGNIWFSNWGGAYKFDGQTIRSYTQQDGLSREVMSITGDQKGNIWLGGGDGLRRFDGKAFTHYNKGLINPGIWTVLADRKGKIWVGTRQTDLYLLDGTSFINYTEQLK